MKKFYLLLALLIPIFFIGNKGYAQNSSTKKSDKIIISIEKKDPTGANLKNGSIQAKISGGNAPYEIRFIGPNMNNKTSNKNQIEFNNLEAGEYLIVVRDKSGNVHHETLELK